MIERRTVCFGASSLGVEQVSRMLGKLKFDRREYNLEPFVTGSCTLTLEADDPRLAGLLEELRRQGEEPFVRAFREYTPAELDRVDWFRLVVNTAGLKGGLRFGQRYDRSGCCPTCGSGVKPVAPLAADTGRMGRKQLDVLAYEGYAVVTSALGLALQRKGLTGFEIGPVRRIDREQPDPGFRWLRIAGEWPSMAPDSVLVRDDPCFKCRRTGHFDAAGEVTEFRYPRAPKNAKDFGYTWEYFSYWRFGKDDSGPAIGGMRAIIVSQKARQALRKLKVRHLGFEPVTFGNGA